MTLFDKTIRKEERIKTVPSWTNVLGSMRRELDASIATFEIFSWKSRKPMIRRPRPIEIPAKFRHENKYCEYYEIMGTLSLSVVNSRKPLMSWLIRDNSTAS